MGRHRKAAWKPKNHPNDLLADPVRAANIPRILDLMTPGAVKKLLVSNYFIIQARFHQNY